MTYTSIRYDYIIGGAGYAVLCNGITGLYRSNLQWPKSEFTIEMWYKSSARGESRYLFSYGSTRSANMFVFGPTAGWIALNGDTSLFPSGLDALLNDGYWHYLGFSAKTGSGGKAELSVNGTVVLEKAIEIPDLEQGGTLVLCQEQDSVGGTFVLSEVGIGLIDEFQIYSKYRTAAEIKSQMFRAPATNDASLFAYYPFDTPNTASDLASNSLTLTKGWPANPADASHYPVWSISSAIVIGGHGSPVYKTKDKDTIANVTIEFYDPSIPNPTSSSHITTITQLPSKGTLYHETGAVINSVPTDLLVGASNQAFRFVKYVPANNFDSNGDTFKFNIKPSGGAYLGEKTMNILQDVAPTTQDISYIIREDQVAQLGTTFDIRGAFVMGGDRYRW